MSLGLLCRAVFHNATARRCHVGMQSRNARRSLMATLSAMQHEQPQQHALRGNSERDVYVELGLVDEPPSRNISPFYGQIPPALTPLQPGTRKTWHESIRLRHRSKNDTIARCFDIVSKRPMLPVVSCHSLPLIGQRLPHLHISRRVQALRLQVPVAVWRLWKVEPHVIVLLFAVSLPFTKDLHRWLCLRRGSLC
jgi:hypothetical protein